MAGRKRCSMDSKMVSEISRSASMRAEQGSGWLSQYGGSSGYITASHLNSTDRSVYLAVNVDGLGNPSEIAQATGLSEAKVNQAITRLNSKGLVSLKAEPVGL